MKLFVGGLPWEVSDAELQAIFEPFGSVRSARVITDRETGRSRGFGFVEMDDSSEAQAAMEKLDGSDLKGRAIRVSEAQQKDSGRR